MSNNTKQRETDNYGAIELCNLQRTSGNRCTGLDIDMIWTYKEQWIAVLDAKHHNISQLTDYDPNTGHQTYTYSKYWTLAEALKIPYFWCVTYMDLPIPMVYMIGANEKGKIACPVLPGSKKYDKGQWMTPMDYSLFNHKMRGIEWNGNEYRTECKCKELGLSDYICLSN